MRVGCAVAVVAAAGVDAPHGVGVIAVRGAEPPEGARLILRPISRSDILVLCGAGPRLKNMPISPPMLPDM